MTWDVSNIRQRNHHGRTRTASDGAATEPPLTCSDAYRPGQGRTTTDSIPALITRRVRLVLAFEWHVAFLHGVDVVFVPRHARADAIIRGVTK